MKGWGPRGLEAGSKAAGSRWDPSGVRPSVSGLAAAGAGPSLSVRLG